MFVSKQLHEAVLEKLKLVTWSIIPALLRNPEDELPCSKMHAIDPFPESEEIQPISSQLSSFKFIL
jgi:hypothetical protein